MFKGANILVVLVTAVVLVALRLAWYGHFAGVGWAALPGGVIAGLTADPIVSLAAFANALVVTVGVAWLASQAGRPSPSSGIAAAAAAFLFFVLTTILQPYIHGGGLQALAVPRDLLIDGGYLALSLVVAGLTCGLGRRRRRARSERQALFGEAPEAAA